MVWKIPITLIVVIALSIKMAGLTEPGSFSKIIDSLSTVVTKFNEQRPKVVYSSQNEKSQKNVELKTTKDWVRDNYVGELQG